VTCFVALAEWDSHPRRIADFHGVLSLRHLWASARRQRQDSGKQQHERSRLGHAGIRAGTRAAAGRVAEVGFPHIVVAGVDRAIAVAVVVAG